MYYTDLYAEDTIQGPLVLLDTWGINKVDSMQEPVEADGSRVDGDTSLSFLLHVVHYRISIIHICRGHTWKSCHSFDESYDLLYLVSSPATPLKNEMGKYLGMPIRLLAGSVI